MAIHFRDEIKAELREMWNLLVKYTIPEGKKEKFRMLFDNSEMKDIIQFKLYKVYARKSGMFDYDCCDKAMEMISALLASNGVEGKITCKTDKRQPVSLRRDIHFSYDGKDYNFDTDTIHSLDSMLNSFFRAADKNYIKIFSEVDGKKLVIRNNLPYYELSVFNTDNSKYYWQKAYVAEKENNRDLWIALIVDEVYKHYSEQQYHNLRQAMKLLNKWASVVDTVGNIMIGPMGFNATKKTKPATRLTVIVGWNISALMIESLWMQ